MTKNTITMLLAAMSSAQILATQITSTSGEVVGFVDGSPLHESRIRVSRDVARTVLAQRHGAAAASDEAKVDQQVREMTCQKLLGFIDNTIRAEEVKRRQISPSQTELDRANGRGTQTDRFERLAAAARKQAEVLSRAMDEVQSGIPVDEAYTKHRDDFTSFGMSLEGWRAFAQRYAAGQLRASLAAQKNMTADELAGKLDEGKWWYVQNQLTVSIDRDIGSSDKTFAEYVKNWRVPNEQAFTIPSDELEYIEARRKEWWRRRYGESKVVLQDQRLYDSCNLGSYGIKASPGQR